MHRCTQCSCTALAGSLPPFATSPDASSTHTIELASTNWPPYPNTPKYPSPLKSDSLVQHMCSHQRVCLLGDNIDVRMSSEKKKIISTRFNENRKYSARTKLKARL
jgi:hypothetical protein